MGIRMLGMGVIDCVRSRRVGPVTLFVHRFPAMAFVSDRKNAMTAMSNRVMAARTDAKLSHTLSAIAWSESMIDDCFLCILFYLSYVYCFISFTNVFLQHGNERLCQRFTCAYANGGKGGDLFADNLAGFEPSRPLQGTGSSLSFRTLDDAFPHTLRKYRITSQR